MVRSPHRRDTDVFIIGGGPAGLAAAIAARQRGFEVVVADSAIPPIDKPCGEGLMPDGISALADLGIEIPGEYSYPFRGIRFISSGVKVDASFPTGQGLGIRRTRLHSLMIDRAAAAGVNLLWQTVVTGLHPDGVWLGRIWCVRDGLSVRTALIPGYASGRVSTKTLATSSVSLSVATIALRLGRVVWSFIGETTASCTSRRLRPMKSASLPSPGTPVCALTRRSRNFLSLLVASKAWSGHQPRGARFRQREDCGSVYRGRTALIGDASGSVDAITGEGLCLAFRQAILLSESFAAGSLEPYQAKHRKLARRPAAMSWLMLTLDGRDLFRQRVMQAFATQPRDFRQDVGLACRRRYPSGSGGDWTFVGMGFADPMKKTTIAAIVVFWLGGATLAQVHSTRNRTEFCPA